MRRHSLPLCLLSLASCTSCAGSPASTAEHFNALAASEESKPDEVIAALRLKPGARVADLGAGGGFYSLELARAVGPEGRVFAVDVERPYLDLIRQSAKEQGVANVETVLGTPQRSNMPAGAVDLVFVRNAFHDISDRETYFAALRTALAPGARVAIIDYLPGGPLRRLYGHAIAPEQIEREMRSAGYQRVESHAFLEKQSFQVFAVAPESPERR